MAGRRTLATDAGSSEAVYRVLRTRIMTCEMFPGQLLTEREIAVEFGLGLYPVRDALTHLVRDGLVQAVRPSTYRITPLTPKSVNDLFAVWALVSPEMAMLGTNRADSGQVAELRQLMTDSNSALVGPLDRDRSARCVDITARVFDLLAVASHSDRLVEAYRSLASEMWRVLTLVLIAADSIDALMAAGATWESTFDRRDALTARQTTSEVVAVTHASAMRVLDSRPQINDRVVVPLRRRTPPQYVAE